MSETTFREVLTYVNVATEQELNLLFDASKRRRRAIQDEQAAVNAASLSKGDRVITKGLRPKYLTGLHGVVDRIDRDRIIVIIDENDRFSLGRYGHPDGRVTVPASCLEAS